MLHEMPHVRELMIRTDRPGFYAPTSHDMAVVADSQIAYGESEEEVWALLHRGAVVALQRGFIAVSHALVTELALGRSADPDWLVVAAARDFVELQREAA